ncbi:MAG: PKD domain-containing protein [Chthoniobacter sp.]|nr:PKD domain-containing protein [Chthoniobacter sp.]
MRFLSGFAFLVLAVSAFAGPRMNHEGRLLGAVPVVTQPVLFNTPEADAVVAAMQIVPVTSAWNEDVSRLPLLANSDAMVAQITADLAANRRTLRPFYEMNYVLVPDAQPLQTIRFFNYPDESDLNGGTSPNGRYPIPANLPVETWPRETGALTLAQWQQDVNNTGGDRHAIIVQPGAGVLWETWLARLVSGAWEASNGAKFDLQTNTLRPAGWTSGDAAGLPMFPALVRYDECQRGVVEHAVRLVVKRTRLGPIYPATHAASVGGLTDPNIPAMGQRLRLKAAFVIPATWTTAEKAVCFALKKYGGLVADNGGFFSFSVCPDDRFAANAFDHLSTIAISNFEVVQSTGATGGPRSPGAPSANAGAPQFAAPGATVAMAGTVTSPSGPATVLWKAMSGPGPVVFANSAQPATTATFTKPGTYLLRLSADDGVHAVAYDAVTVEVVLPVQSARSGADFLVRFPSLAGQTYRVERSPALSPAMWTTLADNLPGTSGTLEVADIGALALPQSFYRVQVLP